MATIDTEFEPIIEILEDILGDYKLHNDGKGQISFDCPVCSHEIKGLDEGDGKGNLEINYKLGVYKCWSCSETHNTRGTLYRLIKKYGNKKQIQFYELMRPEEVDPTLPKPKILRGLPKEFISFATALIINGNSVSINTLSMEPPSTNRFPLLSVTFDILKATYSVIGSNKEISKIPL